MRIARSGHREGLKHRLQNDDELIPEGLLEVMMRKRWTHIRNPRQHSIGNDAAFARCRAGNVNR